MANQPSPPRYPRRNHVRGAVCAVLVRVPCNGVLMRAWPCCSARPVGAKRPRAGHYEWQELGKKVRPGDKKWSGE